MIIIHYQILHEFFYYIMLLIIFHLIGDFVFQPTYVVSGKEDFENKNIDHKWWIISHSSLHGFLVLLATGVDILALLEIFVHSFTDYYKCKGKYSFSTDQIIHFASKIVWSYTAYIIN